MKSYPDIMPDRLLKAIRDGRVITFYQSPEFAYWRGRAIERDNNECQHCKAEGKQGPCEAVHHIKHVKTHPRLGLRLNNLICLCKVHHNLEHPEKFQQKKKEIEFPERWE